MGYAKDLIDKAAEMCGSRYKLAKAIGVSESHLSEAASGKRSVPLKWVPCLAAVARVDAKDALARAMAEELPETSIGRAALKGVTAAGVAVLLLSSHAGDALAHGERVCADRAKVNPLYIVEGWLAYFLSPFFRARRLAGLGI